MEIKISPTDDIVTINGTRCRRWIGTTPQGTNCEVMVMCILTPPDATDFDSLTELKPPKSIEGNYGSHIWPIGIPKPSVN